MSDNKNSAACVITAEEEELYTSSPEQQPLDQSYNDLVDGFQPLFVCSGDGNVPSPPSATLYPCLAEPQKEQPELFQFKVSTTCGDDLRRFALPAGDCTMPGLTQMLGNLYGPVGSVWYIDDEDDKITISSDVELHHALKFCQGKSCLRLFVRPAPACASAPAAAAPSSRHTSPHPTSVHTGRALRYDYKLARINLRQQRLSLKQERLLEKAHRKPHKAEKIQKKQEKLNQKACKLERQMQKLNLKFGKQPQAVTTCV